jgi:hypothetical protein
MSPVEVPPLAVKATALPPTLIVFPAASFACRVSVIVPPEAIVVADAVMSEFAKLGTPGVTVIFGMDVPTEAPAMVAVTVAGVPASTPVKLAV